MNRNVLVGIGVAALVVGGAAVALWPDEPDPPSPAVSGPVDADHSLDVVEHGWTILEEAGSALSLAVVVANPSDLIARTTIVEMTPVDVDGDPVTEPVDIVVDTVPAQARMAGAVVIPSGHVGDVVDVTVKVGATAQWWSDTGDLAPKEELALSGPVDFRDTYDGLSNLEFTLTREQDRTWVDYDAVAVFRDGDGQVVGGCKHPFNIVGNRALTRILDCPVPEVADRDQTEVFADVVADSQGE